VSEAKAAFLPSLNLNFLYTPTQASPLLKIPAGVFGANEQTFRANLTRQNVMRFDISQPLYTGGRLSNAYAAQAAGEESSRLDLERSRQALVLQLYEAFYSALMNGRESASAKKGSASRRSISSWRRRGSAPAPPRVWTSFERRSSYRTRRQS
jgi:outer membrane protein TolC